MKSRICIIALLFSVLVPHLSPAQDSVSVYFPTGSSKISDSIQDRIDALFLAEKIQGARTIAIYGYADEPGTAALNRRLSSHRAAALRSYLLQWGIKPAQVIACEGRGHASGSGVSAADRRADIFINKVLPPDPIIIQAPPGKFPAAAPAAPPAGLAGLNKLQEGEAMQIDSLLFVQGADLIIKSSGAVLKQLADILIANPRMKVRLEGHICCLAAGRYEPVDHRLSEYRAKAVYKYLISHGVEASRLSYRGLGNTAPKRYPEITEEDRQANRRVEVRILSK